MSCLIRRHPKVPLRRDLRGAFVANLRHPFAATAAFARRDAGHCRPLGPRLPALAVAAGDCPKRDLRFRDGILQAAAYAAERFLAARRWDDAVQDVLARLGQVTGVSRVYVFENHDDGQGRGCASQRFEWVADGVAALDGLPDVSDLPLFEPPCDVWTYDLSAGRPVAGVADDFGPAQQALLDSQEILSVALVPVFVGASWWGFIGFDDCRTSRRWSAVEIDALRVVATTLAAALRRRQDELALRESRERYRVVVESVREVIFQLDSAGRWAFLNPVWEELTGWRVAEALGRSFEEFVHPDDLGRTRARIEKLLGGREKQARSEIRYVTRSGSTRWVEVTGTSLRGPDGTIVGVSGTINDVTERIESQRSLLAAKEEAEAASRAKSQFLANMSHEMRTPLNAIVGLTDLMLEGDLPAEAREYAEQVRGSGSVLHALINDLLDLSKIEAGRVDLDPQPFDVRVGLEDAVELVAAAAAQKGLELICDVDPDIPRRLVGDVARLRQVLVNVLANAVKFTDRGEVALSARCRPSTAGEQRQQPSDRGGRSPTTLLVEVRDTGIGMDVRDKERLFRAFEQADASTTRRFGGTGLGLAISRRLVRMMGGTIDFDSVQGAGTTFRLSVVLGVEDDGAGAAHAPVLLEGRRAVVACRSRRLSESLVGCLQTWGLDAVALGEDVALADGEGALAAADLLISDCCERDNCDTSPCSRVPQEAAVIPVAPFGQTLHCARAAVVVTKPVRERALLQATLESLSAAATGPQTGPSDGMRGDEAPALDVLVVEDHRVNQLVAERMLRRMGHAVEIVANGLEALSALERGTYDVVLMDVQMPEMDGVAATRAIHERWGERRPRIVAMTANALDGDRERYLAAGMDDYISKPVRTADLERALAAAVTLTAK
jgi:PAS domain S-box-containing protein